MQIEQIHARRGPLVVISLILLLALMLQLALTAHRESQTWDEGCHIFSGYTYWKSADFGMNPEHPPLVKLLATLPLLRLPLRVPRLQERSFKIEAFLNGGELLYRNDADRILFRTRMAAALLTVLLALLVFAAAREMFGAGIALLALALLAFEPNILAHGALVTTDMGVTCFLFATVYALFRYLKQASLFRLALVGASAGLTLAAKHSGILVFPILVLLLLTDVFRSKHAGEPAPAAQHASRWRMALRHLAALAAIGLLAIAVLWSFYGFRYSARPAGLQLSPSLKEFAAGLQRSSDIRVIHALARWHVLPEAYLYGLVDVRNNADLSRSYMFGTLLPPRQWSFYPLNLLIKSTLGFLLLLAGALIAICLRRRIPWREALFVLVPAVFFLLFAIYSGPNRGIRHILPVYPFLIVIAAAGAWALKKHSRRWGVAVAVFLLLHIGSSVRAFPAYLPYVNELWGGSANSYKYFTDSNADWGQQLKAASRYLKQRGIKRCWLASYVGEIVDARYYGIPCQSLPTAIALWSGRGDSGGESVPARIDGPVLVSASLIYGFEFAGGELNPYSDFRKLRPSDVIEHGIFVYNGSFDIPRIATLHHLARSVQLSDSRQYQRALEEAQAAAMLSPGLASPQVYVGDALSNLNRPDEARKAYETALIAAQTVEPAYQQSLISYVQGRLAAK